MLKVIVGALVVLGLFLIYVSTRNGSFRYERSGVIQAPAEKIFPYISEFKKAGEWSPYEQMDPQMKKTYSGTEGAVGSKMEFDGNKDVGSGSLEVLNVVPQQSVNLKLIMTKPFYAENLIEYKLTPEGSGTRFTWAMSGNGGFLGKLLSVLVDCEKMVGGQMEKGIQNLKTLIEPK